LLTTDRPCAIVWLQMKQLLSSTYYGHAATAQ